MQTYEPADIKRRPDGSIDAVYYMNIGRQLRSEEAYKLVKAAVPKRKRFSFWVWPLLTIRTERR